MNNIINGDALEELKKLPEKSINMCMTSSPYWALRDYGSEVETIFDGDKNCEHGWEEYIQPQRGGKNKKDNLPSVGSNKYLQESNSMGYGNPIKSNFCNKCGAWKGQLGLEPTFDLYIKHLCDIFDEIKRVLRDDGTCWVNLGDTYYGGGKDGKYCKEGVSDIQLGNKGSLDVVGSKFKSGNYKDKCLTMIPFRFAIEMVNRGWILRNTIIWYKKNCMPSSVKDRFTVDFEYIFFFSKKKKYYFETQYEPSVDPESYKGIRPRNAHNMSKYDMKHYAFAGSVGKDGKLKMSGKKYPNRNKRTTWQINPKGFKEAHFAVYPEKLCQIPIRAGCPEGGIIIDPFFGAGTTGVVALKQNKKFIGIELNKEYIEIANKRLKPYLEQTKL